MRSALDAALADALPAECVDEVVIVVGFIDQGLPVLLTCEKGAIIDNKQLVHFGSFNRRPDLVAQVEDQVIQGIAFVNAEHLAGTIEDDFHQTVLSRVTAFLQSIGIHNPLIDIGVGGTFVSAAITTNYGFVWPKCNAYVLYPTISPFRQIRTITVRYVDNIVFIAVKGHDTIKAFVPGITIEEINSAKKKYTMKNFEELALSSNYIFLSTTFRHIFIVHKTPKYPDRWFRIVEKSTLAAKLKLSDQLTEKLFNENNPKALIDELW